MYRGGKYRKNGGLLSNSGRHAKTARLATTHARQETTRHAKTARLATKHVSREATTRTRPAGTPPQKPAKKRQRQPTSKNIVKKVSGLRSFHNHISQKSNQKNGKKISKQPPDKPHKAIVKPRMATPAAFFKKKDTFSIK